MESNETKKKRYLSTADTIEKRAKKEWAKAKNSNEGYRYNNARKDFEKAQELRDKAKKL